MKSIVEALVIAGFATLVLGAFVPPAPVSYRLVRSNSTTRLEQQINELAGEGCRVLQIEVFAGPRPEVFAVLECK